MTLCFGDSGQSKSPAYSSSSTNAARSVATRVGTDIEGYLIAEIGGGFGLDIDVDVDPRLLGVAADSPARVDSRKIDL